MRLKKVFSFVILSVFGFCFAHCSKHSDDSISAITSGYYVAESGENLEIPLVSFFVADDKTSSFEFKRITWQDGSRYEIFAKGGNVHHYDSGMIPGSTSVRSSGQGNSHTESTVYYPLDVDRVRVELTKAQATPAWSDKKEYTFRKTTVQEFKARFQAETGKIIQSKDELQPDRLTKEQTDYCQVNFSQSCLDALK